MNIQEVPPAPEENNILQFAIRTRLKLFYRPQGIATSLPKAVENLQWQQSANTLSFTNNSPLHITVINAEAIDNKGQNLSSEKLYVAAVQSPRCQYRQHAALA